MKNDKVIMKFARIVLFSVSAIVFLTVPGMQIIKYNDALKNGERILFRVQGYDPYDPFRGRYVQIRIEPSRYTLQEDDKSIRWEDKGKENVYMHVGVNESGVGYFTGVSKTPPDSGVYWKLKTLGRVYNYSNQLSLDIPLNRFYMNEYLAGPAEKYLTGDWQNVRVALRFKDGLAVIEEIYIGDKPLAQLVREKQ